MKLAEEQRELAARWVPFARGLAGRMMSAHPARADDIHSAALLALTTAARDYDPGRGLSFSTFARHRIAGEIRNAVRLESGGLGGLSLRLRDGQPSPRCRPSDRLDLGRPIGLGSTPPPDAGAIGADAAERMLRGLPAKARRALRLIAFEGMTHGEAAAAMGCSQSEVSRLVAQSRTLLGGPPCSC